ncbi:hypothetical protein A3K89_07180 [Rhodococcoides kyotonense]|uniref:Uncharacterized protein n=1 Tax=Rhodococcoides kyotonense TaxID=398843 RepID=A0A177YBW0_9NOCA|nr:hypothetical protein A3K89_07180 [Rhodococcus kyotonensis]
MPELGACVVECEGVAVSNARQPRSLNFFCCSVKDSTIIATWWTRPISVVVSANSVGAAACVCTSSICVRPHWPYAEL